MPLRRSTRSWEKLFHLRQKAEETEPEVELKHKLVKFVSAATRNINRKLFFSLSSTMRNSLRTFSTILSSNEHDEPSWRLKYAKRVLEHSRVCCRCSLNLSWVALAFLVSLRSPALGDCCGWNLSHRRISFEVRKPWRRLNSCCMENNVERARRLTSLSIFISFGRLSNGSANKIRIANSISPIVKKWQRNFFKASRKNPNRPRRMAQHCRKF